MRLSELTKGQIETLAETTGMKQTEIVSIAIDRMFREETRMSKQHDRITQKLGEAGAAWAVQSWKYCGANDPYEDQTRGRKTYHINPDASYPNQNHIQRFGSLDEIERWLSGNRYP